MPKMILASTAPASPNNSPPPLRHRRSQVELELPAPTNAPPGTPEKIAILKMRMERGFALHHPDDRTYDPPPPEAEPERRFPARLPLHRTLGISADPSRREAVS